jgi:molybdopterin molybdotransferase
MDGYAFAFSGHDPDKSLRVVGSIPAGTCFKGNVPPGSAVKIMTGAPVPEECDTVIPVEDVEEEGGSIRLQKAARKGDHVRRRGEEIGKGEILIEQGTLIGPWELGMLAAAGIVEVKVIPKPTVAVLSTGNELIELGQTPGPGQIINSNLYVLEACLQREGCEVVSLGVARDNIDSISRKVSEGLQADMIVSTGGVSAGDHDCVKDALQRYDFRLGFWKVRIKPGKPVLFGTIHEKPVFGLPGNPASASASFELFVFPALRRLAGFEEALQPRLRAVLARKVRGDNERQRFLWGSLQEDCGCYNFIPSSRQSSGQARSMDQAHALMSVPIGALEVPEGSVVEVIPIRLPPRRTK